MDGYTFTPYTGSFADGTDFYMNNSGLEYKNEGCAKGDEAGTNFPGAYFYYKVLIPR
jgi:hypothetical protein